MFDANKCRPWRCAAFAVFATLLTTSVYAQAPKAKPAAKPAPAETAVAPIEAQAQTADLDVSWKAKAEIARRGPMVERINGFEAADDTILLTEALSPPADDSNKWLLTLVTTKNCKYCEQLRGDLDSSPALKPWVDAKDYTKSWFHYQIVQIEDQSQAWRWKDFKPTSFPTLLIQPPFDRSWGDPHTIVFKKEGYDGKADKLAVDFRAAIDRYTKKVKPERAAWKSMHNSQIASNGGHQVGFAQAVQAGGWNPPATPPSMLPPAQPATPQIPPQPAADPTSAQADQILSIVLGLVSMIFPDAKTLLLVLTAASNVLMYLRDRRQQPVSPTAPSAT